MQGPVDASLQTRGNEHINGTYGSSWHAEFEAGLEVASASCKLAANSLQHTMKLGANGSLMLFSHAWTQLFSQRVSVNLFLGV